MRKMTVKKKMRIRLGAGVVLAVLLATGCFSPALAQFNAFKEPKQSSASSASVSGPDMAAVADTIQGGSIAVGGTAYVVALFQNTGTSPVKVTGINLYPSSTATAVVSLNKCADAELPPEGQCAVTVSVTGVQEGPWRVEILLDHNGKKRLALAALTGDVQTAKVKEAEKSVVSEIEAIPAAIDFGNTTGGVSLVRSIALRNNTADSIDIKDITLDMADQSGFTITPACPPALKPSEICSVSVVWTPFTKGLAQGVLRIQHSGKSGMAQVEIKGSFAPAAVSNATIYPENVPDKGLLITDKDKIDFGTAVKGASAITVSLVNAGSTSLTLRNIRLSGSDNGLSIARYGCASGMTLAPVEACPLTINWVPSRAGDVIDDLQVQHSGARGILVLPIRGKADAAVSRETLVIRQAPPPKRDIVPTRSMLEPNAPRPILPDMSLPAISDLKIDGDADRKISEIVPNKSALEEQMGRFSKPDLELSGISSMKIDDLDEEVSRKISEIVPNKSMFTPRVEPPSLSDINIGNDIGAAVFEDASAVTPALDGYIVTSHSATRAVINGPVGSFIVRDGEDVVISGAKWAVTIVSTGVVLTSQDDELLLVFDQSLKPQAAAAGPSPSSPAAGESAGGAPVAPGARPQLPGGGQ